MKKINFRGLSERLSEKELKNVLGGSGTGPDRCWSACSSNSDCDSACPHCALSSMAWEDTLVLVHESIKIIADKEKQSYMICKD